jgi:hypothetical protein
LTYYIEDTDKSAIDLANGGTFVASSDEASYIPASKDAIDAACTEADGWVAVTSDTKLEDNLAPLSGYLTVPANVTLYVKVSEGKSTTSDSVVENGYNYEFIGYYTETTSDGDKYYAVSVTDPTYDSSSTISEVAHAVNNKLSVTVQPTKKCTYTYNDAAGQTAIDNMVELIFNGTDGAVDTDKWYVQTLDTDGTAPKTTYYYYKPILKSGTTTEPLLKAVKFKDTFTGEVYDAQFDLNVKMTSTQAIYEAAETTFKAETSGVNKDNTNLVDSNFSATTANLEKNTSIDTSGNKAASSNSSAVIPNETVDPSGTVGTDSNTSGDNGASSSADVSG